MLQPLIGEETLAGDAPVAGGVLGVRVAGLSWTLDARGTGINLAAPPGHQKFLEPLAAGSDVALGPGRLLLHMRHAERPWSRDGGAPLCVTEIWELWLDEAGRYAFVAPRASPPRWAVVDSGFTSGEVRGSFPTDGGNGLYPLQGLDNVMLANWLASYGDVILHASGVVIGEQAYCFIGPAGAGKSTAAASLSRDPAVTVLGEDQVVLRYLDGRFWIYGTPWHLNPAMCSPLGAPLARLFVLDKEAPPGSAPCGPMDGVARMLQTAFVPYYRREGVAAILDRLALLAEQVPFYTLGLRLGDDVLDVIGAG